MTHPEGLKDWKEALRFNFGMTVRDPDIMKSLEAFIEGLIKETGRRMKGEAEEDIDNLYTAFEEESPPSLLVTAHEQSYNNGFYQGRLNAMEKVCQVLFQKSGSDLAPTKE